MTRYICCLLIVWIGYFQFLSAQTGSDSFRKVIYAPSTIRIRIGSGSGRADSVVLEYMTTRHPWSKRTSASKKSNANETFWEIVSETPVTIYTENFIKRQRGHWLAEPGDDVIIEYNGKGFVFSGKGAEKFRLQHEIDSILLNVEKPKNPNNFTIVSEKDFFDFHSFCNRKLALALPHIEKYKNKVSPFIYNSVKAGTIARIQEDRLDKFSAFRSKTVASGWLTRKELCEIFDSCFYQEPWKWVLSMPDYISGWYAFIRAEVGRMYEFDYMNENLTSRSNRKFIYYEQGKKTYKGEGLQRFLFSLVTKETMYELGFTPETEKLVAFYYADPEVEPEYKTYAKEYETKMRILSSGKTAPEFELTDIENRPFKKDDLKGKIALMDFWFTGCAGCIQMTPALEKVENFFKNDSGIVFLSISTDKDKAEWINSIAQEKYTTGNGINLYTGGKGRDHHMMTAYSVSSYPSLYLIDTYGKIAQYPVPDPREDNGKELIRVIQEQLVLMKDGPYLLHDGSIPRVYYVNGNSVKTKEIDKTKPPVLSIPTDQPGKSFNVGLKSELTVEPCEFSQPSKMLILSDIEGNFDAFRKLLQSNKVIDENYNWTFNDGHLVLNGDIFDRGKQVTECLWLIYSLEEKAKRKNGYVHFILGNHEIMNLCGDTRYVQLKYQENARNIAGAEGYSVLYGKNSEIGRWLRTKNIMEKIGDNLFTHAGISEAINRSPLSIRQFNDLARPYYDRDSTAKNSANPELRILFDSKSSPFWFRLYYLTSERRVSATRDTVYKTPMKQVDETLRKFGVNHILTGHTILYDTISVHYNGKVFNTDTMHAAGKSEALLVEGGNYYRVSADGKKMLLYRRPDSFFSTSTDL